MQQLEPGLSIIACIWQDLRPQIVYKLHCSNKGYQLLTNQGWVEGQGLGAIAGGLTKPFIPMHQSGAEARLGLGCIRCNPILTGKGAEDELRVGCLIYFVCLWLQDACHAAYRCML